MVNVGIVDFYIGTHFGEFANHQFGTAIASVADIFAIGGAEDQNVRGGERFAHVAEGIAHELRRLKRARVVDVYGGWSDFKNVIFKAEDVFVSPEAKASVLGKAIASDTRARKDH